MTQLQALIFDVDGTIADTERDGHRVAFNRAFAKAGLDWHWSVPFYGELLAIAGGKERIRHYLQHHQPDFHPPTDTDTFVAHLHAAKTQHYRQLAAEGAIPLRPGVRRLLEAARSQGIRLAIATTGAMPNILALLKHTLGEASPGWFEVIAAGDVVPAKKPAPDIYLYALEQMGLQAADCLAIEDSQHGLEAARKAGLQAIVTVNAYTQNQDFSEALLVLNHLGEPEQPFTVLQGDAGDRHYFDFVLAQHLHESAQW